MPAHRQRRGGDVTVGQRTQDLVVFLGGIVWTALATRPGWVGWALAVGGALWMARQLTRR